MAEENIVKYYTVTSLREVKVASTSPLEAAKTAQLAFDGGENVAGETYAGRVLKPVKQRTLEVTEDY